MRPVGVAGSRMVAYIVLEWLLVEGMGCSSELGCLRLLCRCWSKWPLTVGSVWVRWRRMMLAVRPGQVAKKLRWIVSRKVLGLGLRRLREAIELVVVVSSE